MASGNTIFVVSNVHGYSPPSSNFATVDNRNNHKVLDFDPSLDEAAVFAMLMPRHYDGGGITVYAHFAMTTATSGNVVLGTSFERIGDQIQDIDSDSFATENTTVFAVPTTSGLVKIAGISHTDGAQIDSIAVGEAFRLKIRRLGTNGADTATGDLELIRIELKEN